MALLDLVHRRQRARQVLAHGVLRRLDLARLDGFQDGQVASLDAPVMLRVLRAARVSDAAGVARWNAFLLAHRESREFALRSGRSRSAA